MKFLLLAAVLTGSLATAAPMYTLTNVGGLGGSRSEAFAVGVHGAVVGTALDEDERSRGFIYEQFISPLGGDTDLRAINAEGAIVGSSQGYATIWRSGTAENLGTLGGASSSGLALNDLGYVTGAAGRSDGRIHAFLYADGQMIDIGTLGGASSAGYAINSAGQIAGTSETALGQSHAFIWNEAAGMRDLGTLGGRESRAMAINSGGVVAGAATNRGRYFHATVWEPGRGITDIGTLGGAHSYAYGINDAGVVVGSSYDSEGKMRAFVWTRGMLFDLNDLVTDTPGWSLTAAYGINHKGQIVGSGLFNGQSTAFRLDPISYSDVRFINTPALSSLQTEVPEPAAVPEPCGLAAVGLAGLLAWRWRRGSIS